jgi:uncharacterized protein YqgC (DUF456 family)
MTKRQIYYNRVVLVLVALVLVVVGVAVPSAPTTLFVGVGILIGTYFVNRIARYVRLAGRMTKRP